MGFGLDDWIYCHFMHSARNYRQLRSYRYSHNLQVTVTHTSVLSLLHSPLVFSWQRIYKSHCSSHIKSSLQSLIPLLPLFSITFECRFSQFSAASANSGIRLSSNSSCLRTSLYSLGTDPQKTPFPLILLVDSLLKKYVCRTVAL
jgi:hypothetical protein